MASLVKSEQTLKSQKVGGFAPEFKKRFFLVSALKKK